MGYTPREYLEVRDSGEARVMGLEWQGQPYGVLLCEDSSGGKFTLVTEDIAFHRMLTGASPDTRASLEIPPGKYPLVRPGWPGEPGWS